MVKKIYNGLILLFFIAILLFCGNDLSIKEYDKVTNQYFDATIYLKTTVNQKDTIEHLKAIADEHDLTIAKIIPDDDSGTGIFVYSHDNKYTKEFLSSYKITKDLKNIQTFYNKEIILKSLDDLENLGVEGRYALNIGDKLNVEGLVNEVNRKYENEITLFSNQKLENTFTSNVNSLRYNYGLVLIAILFVTLLTTFLHDINSRKKEIAIKNLLGYDTKDIFYDIFMKKAVIPIAFSILLSEIVVSSFFIFNGNIKNLHILRYFLSESLKLSIFFAIVFIVVFALFLLFSIAGKKQRLKIVSYIKGEENSRNILSIVVKMSSTLFIVVIFGVLFVSSSFILDKRRAVQQWEKTKEYATLNMYIPQDILHDKKRQAEFEQTHNMVWNYLNDKDGILFYKTTNKINENPILIDNKEVDIPFVYINDNYLKENHILDTLGNRVIPLDEHNSNKIVVLVPSCYKPYEEELRQIIHKNHVFDKYISEDIHKEWITGEKSSLSKENLNNPDITEEYIYIKDDQLLFTYTAGGDFVENAILAIVNGENMGLNVYTPSISGDAGIKVKYNDINRLNKETRYLFNSLGYGEVDTDFSSVYQQNAQDIEYFKNMIVFSIIVIALNIIFLIFSLFFYLEIYFLNNRKKIAIKSFLGYGFFLRNKKALMGLIIQDTVIILVSLMFANFVTNKIMGIQIIYPIIFISIIIVSIDILCSSVFLKGREIKFIVKTLKGD